MIRRTRWSSVLLPLLLGAQGCGGASRSAYGSGTSAREEAAAPAPSDAPGAMPVLARTSSGFSFDADEGESTAEPPSEPVVTAPLAAPPTTIAQADRAPARGPSGPPTPPVPAQQPTRAPDESQTATDATSGPLLIYEAVLHLAVYQVQDNQRSVIGIARELGGYLQQQADTVVVVRVPARKFQEALARIEALGDVLHRNIQAQDVSEEFRDLGIRLRNLEQIRDRLASLLSQARTVEESLQIERELERVTTAIESMKGRLRFLEDRIAFSTITINFSPREQENLQGELFNLPFDFLYNLGLRTLMDLR